MLKAPEYVRREGVWHVNDRGLLRVVPKESVPEDVRRAEAEERNRRASTLSDAVLASRDPARDLRVRTVTRDAAEAAYARIVVEAYVPGSDPREFRVDGMLMPARLFALYVGANVLLLDLDLAHEWYGRLYHRNNTILLEAGHRLRDEETRSAAGEGDGESHYPVLSLKDLSFVASVVREKGAA